MFTKGPSDVLDHATSEIASGSKLGIDATKKRPGEGFKRPWPPLIKMDAAVRNKMNWVHLDTVLKLSGTAPPWVAQAGAPVVTQDVDL